MTRIFYYLSLVDLIWKTERCFYAFYILALNSVWNSLPLRIRNSASLFWKHISWTCINLTRPCKVFGLMCVWGGGGGGWVGGCVSLWVWVLVCCAVSQCSIHIWWRSLVESSRCHSSTFPHSYLFISPCPWGSPQWGRQCPHFPNSHLIVTGIIKKCFKSPGGGYLYTQTRTYTHAGTHARTPRPPPPHQPTHTSLIFVHVCCL